jgi:UDP-GlcNAc3NAcA epimerase
MRRILSVVGARPQFVKAAVFSRFVRRPEFREQIEEILVHTGQHYDENMSEVFFREMDIPTPDVNLNVGSGQHGAMTAAMLAGIERLIQERKPDIVLVYGDTNSTLAGALAASKLHVPVAHVEAGLRSYMMAMPEEQNRRLTDHLSTWLFCPTSTAIKNLEKEGIPNVQRSSPSADQKSVVMSGDIMLEASTHYRRIITERPDEGLQDLPEEFYLLTIHRAENTDDPARLASIVDAVNERSDKKAVFPIHPRTRKILAERGLSFGPHVRLIEPVGYFQMLRLEHACSFVVTDSGGVQKEAYFFAKPCITLRDTTEWVELVTAGWNTLAGTDRHSIAIALASVAAPTTHPPLYGDGNCAETIVRNLI